MCLPFTLTTLETKTDGRFTLLGPLGAVVLSVSRGDALLDAPFRVEVWLHRKAARGAYCTVVNGPCEGDVLATRLMEPYRRLVDAGVESDIYAALEAEYYRSLEQEARR